MAEANTYERTPFYKMRYHTLNVTPPDETNARKRTKQQPSATSKLTHDTGANPSPGDLRTQQKSSITNTASVNTPTADSMSQRRQSMLELNRWQHPIASARISSPPSLTDWPFADPSTGAPADSGTPVLKQQQQLHHQPKDYRECPPLPGWYDYKTQSNIRLNNMDNSGTAPMPPPRTTSGKAAAGAPSGMEPFSTLDDAAAAVYLEERLAELDSAYDDSDSMSNGERHTPIPSGELRTIPTQPTPGPNHLQGASPMEQDTQSRINFSRPTMNARHSITPSTVPISNATVGHPSTLSNGNTSGTNGKLAALNLLERYKLPAVCLAESPDRPPSTPGGIMVFPDKKHQFKVHTFRGPHWCDFCTHFIWGLVSQGVKCADCGFQAHKRCSDRVPDDCFPDIKRMKRVFGVDLTNLTVAENKRIPSILERCIAELENRDALLCEGIYRIPGNHDRVEQIRLLFDKGGDPAILALSRVTDVNVITSLLKAFLRELPVPLITYDAYPKLMDIVRNDTLPEEEKLFAMGHILSNLPPAHYDTLRYFLRHMHRVASYEGQNMMSIKNLSVVLAPTLMSSTYTNPIDCMAGMQAERMIVKYLIEHFEILFPNEMTESSTGYNYVPRSSFTAMANTLSRPIPGIAVINMLRNRRSIIANTNNNSNATSLSSEAEGSETISTIL